VSKTITIHEDGKPPATAPTVRRFDVQDALVVSGFILLEYGVALLSCPVALILAGATFYFFAVLIERARARK
jgi:hypothetical protein